MLREIESSNETLQCVSFSGAAAHVVLPTSTSDCRLYWRGTTRPVRLRHSAPVHVTPAQHKWTTELARTNSKSRCSAPLFLASSGNVATKVQVSSTVRQAAGKKLETLTGAPCTSHSVVSMRGGSGCMAVGLEASLGRDVQEVQMQILAGKAESLNCRLHFRFLSCPQSTRHDQL